MAGFRTSQPFYDECNNFYGDGFDDCLKQIATLYPHLDLSKIVIDNTVPLTFGGTDAIIDEADDSIHLDKKKVKKSVDVEAVDQNAFRGQTVPNRLTALDGSSAPEDLSTP